MEYLLIFLKNKILLYGSRAYIASVLSLAGSRLYVLDGSSRSYKYVKKGGDGQRLLLTQLKE